MSANLTKTLMEILSTKAGHTESYNIFKRSKAKLGCSKGK